LEHPCQGGHGVHFYPAVALRGARARAANGRFIKHELAPAIKDNGLKPGKKRKTPR
jgi:hypothetical protein